MRAYPINRRDFLIAGAGGALFAALPSACARAPAAAPSVWIVGDSIGEGLRWASGAPGDTKRGLSLVGNKTVLHQIAGAPKDALVIISLGTNDALVLNKPERVGVVAGAVIANAGGRRIVWVGPPRPDATWAGRAYLLDQALALAVPKAGGRYVSAFATPGLFAHHAKDGVHFDLAGYRLLWEAVR